MRRIADWRSLPYLASGVSGALTRFAMPVIHRQCTAQNDVPLTRAPGFHGPSCFAGGMIHVAFCNNL